MPFRHQLPVYSPVRLLPALGRIGRRPVARLEELVSRRYEAPRVTLHGTATQALTAALLRVAPAHGPKRVVALPGYSCFDLASAVVGAEARVRFYDLDPGTLGPEIASLREAHAAGVDAVVIAPLYGYPVDWEGIAAALGPGGIASGRATLIEDAAQGFGATWRGQPVGSFGEMSVLSFGRGKGWTGGAGGALLVRETNGDSGAPRDRPPPLGSASSLRLLATTFAQALLGRPELYWIPAALPFFSLGETVYHPPREIRPMAPLPAALALASEGAAAAEASRRPENARAILERLRSALGSRWGTEFREIPPLSGGSASYLRLPILAATGMRGFADPREARRAGIMPGYPVPLPELPVLRERTVGDAGVPGSREMVHRLITLPTHTLVTPRDIDRIAELLVGYRS